VEVFCALIDVAYGTAKTELARDRVATRVVEKCISILLAMQLLAVRRETFQRDIPPYIYNDRASIISVVGLINRVGGRV
jgi:hypothetical protein